MTLVGRVRQHTVTSNGLNTYQVQINSVLSGTAEADEGAMVTVVTSQRPQLRRGSKFVFHGTMFGSELYVVNIGSVLVYSSQLEAFIRSC